MDYSFKLYDKYYIRENSFCNDISVSINHTLVYKKLNALKDKGYNPDLIFDTTNWETTTTSNSITSYYLNSHYTKYPTAQTSTQTLLNSTISGNMIVSGSTICDNIYNYTPAGSVPTTAEIYNTTTGTGFKIRIGGNICLLK
jgi:hypothetical protein